MSQAVKKVRFASEDPGPSLSFNRPVVTNTYQPLEYCKTCGSARFGPPSGSGCKNCLIPKPAIKPAILNHFSKSDQSLNKISLSNGNDKEITFEIPSETSTSYFKQPKLFKPEANEFKYFEAQPVPRPRKINEFIWTCFKCKEVLKPGEVAISADHVDPAARWHPKCFVCKVCNELLVDLLYYNRDKDIYCQRHFFETKSRVICAACDGTIKTMEYVKAEGLAWHVEHFICWKCESPLGGQKYIVVDSKPFCFNCHSTNFSKACHTCRQKIQPELVRLTFDNLNWHAAPECFKCFTCEKNLLETHFLLKNNLLFCSLDCKKQVSVV